MAEFRRHAFDGSLARGQDPLGRFFLTVGEVAAMLRTNRRVIYATAERGQLPGLRRVGRRLLVQRAELLEWLGHHDVPSPTKFGR